MHAREPRERSGRTLTDNSAEQNVASLKASRYRRLVPRLYRKQPDSSVLIRPRVFVRVFPEMGTLKRSVRFYEALSQVDLDIDREIPEADLHVVGVGAFLILDMDPEKLDRIEQAKQTLVTVLAPDLEEAVKASVQEGSVVVQERWQSPPGPGYRLRHPDGRLVEYLEHRPSADDVDTPSDLLS
jgi:predicted enzyme related to lactoylglutathione lyase